jgi:hypothetical protein
VILVMTMNPSLIPTWLTQYLIPTQMQRYCTYVSYTLPLYQQLLGSPLSQGQLPVDYVFDIPHLNIDVRSRWGLGVWLRCARWFSGCSLSY